MVDTAPLYADQRIKLQNPGNSKDRSRQVGVAMHNLDSAKIIQLIHPTADIEPPSKPNIKKITKTSVSRLQFLNTGW